MKKQPALRVIQTACLLVIVIPSFAQFPIRGRVLDVAGLPVPDAIIVIASPADSSMIATALPDSNGRYSFPAQAAAGALIRAGAPGFAEQFQRLADPATAPQTIDFNLVPQSKTLEAVTVSGRKPLFERRADRTIFNVSASLTAIGGTALDAVKKSPGVLVRAGDGSISLVGKSTVRVLVNGRLIQLSGEDLMAYLQSIPSENLERIEVITTPPAQYDAAGNSGLINLVLKQQRRAGVNGDVRAGYEQSGFGTAIAGASFNYRSGRLNVYGATGYNKGAKDITERLQTDYPGQTYYLSNPYRRATRTLQYTLGADYQLHKTGVLGVELTGTDFVRQSEDQTDMEVRRVPANTIDSTIRTTALSGQHNRNNIVNINYAWSIDTSGRKLTINGNRLWFNGTRDRDYDTQNYYGLYVQPTGPLSRNQNRGRQQISITTAAADLELPYTWAALSLGGKLSFTDNNSRNNFLYFDQGSFHDDPAVSNEFRYTEQVQALYASAKRTFGKWELQGGLRGEWTQTSGYSARNARTTDNRYVNLFPTAYVQYNKDKNNVFTLNYSKRIDRPGYRALDPYRSYSSPYSYIEGNPGLKPSVIHAAEAGYSWKGQYTLTAFQQVMPGTFGQVFYVDSVLKATYVRTENYGDFYNSGIQASATFHPRPEWELTVQASASRSWVKVHYTNAAASGRPVNTAYLMLNNSFPLNKAKTLLAAANIFYISSYLNDLMRMEPQCNLDAGLKALLLDKKLVISLNANDILRTVLARGTNVVTGQQLNSYFDERNVRLMVNYKFGNRSIKGKRERSTGIEEERSRT